MRTVDENKITQVEAATIEFVVKRGYGGASISEIAKRAGVSKGYLYRFYKNKQELVQTLLTRYIDVIIERIEDLLNQDIAIDQVITFFINHTFEFGKEHPDHIKFIYVLLHDYTFQLEDAQRLKIKKITQRLYTVGTAQGLVNPASTEEEIFSIAVIYPINFINLKYKRFFSDNAWNKEDIDRVTAFCINALK